MRRLLAAALLLASTAAIAGGLSTKPYLLGGAPNFLPRASGQVPTVYANFANSQYWANGTQKGGFSSWLSALGGTFTRADAVAGSASYVNSAGLVAFANANVARFTYDPVTLAPQGILLEGSRINFDLQSNTFSDAAWSLNTLSASQNVVGPTGVSNSGWTITAPNGTGNHSFNPTTGTNRTGGTTYVATGFVKQGTYRFIFVNIQVSANNYVTAVFDLGAGAGSATQTSVGATDGTIVSTSFSAASNGFFRYQIVYSFASTHATTFHSIGFATAATGNTFTTSGAITTTTAGTETFLVYGLQEEAASFPSSYIPTTSASVTRAADSLTWPFTQTAVTAYLKSTSNEDPSPSTNYRMLVSGSTDNRLVYRSSPTAARSFNNSTALTYPDFTGTWNAVHKFAISGNASGRTATVDGITPATDANAINSGTVTTIGLGDAPGGTAFTNYGTFGEVAIWNNLVASSADLKRLTQ